jgi:hypothetical protein
MSKHQIWVVLLCGTAVFFTVQLANGQGGTGDVVVRVDDTSGSHCIDADTEKITVFVRRVFTEKHAGLFTQDNKAGVLVRSQLVANNTDPKQAEPAPVQVPSVDMVSVKDDQKGRVSLALEYAIASNFVLSQGNTVTKTMDIYMNLAKAKGKSTFGEVLDLAGQALNQVSLPQNPYTQAGSKFLKFANSAIDSSIKADNDDQIAHIGLQFKEGEEKDLAKCESAGDERTGAIAVLRSVGAAAADLIPVTNTEQQYCFRYSSGSTYELLAAKRNQDGSCPAPNTFKGVMNDYVMLLISGEPVKKPGKAIPPETMNKLHAESVKRCKAFNLAADACGVQ